MSEPPVMSPGANRELPAHTLSAYVDIVMSHVSRPGVDLDLSVVAVDSGGRVTHENDFVFFNNTRHRSGSVEHLGQRASGGRSWDAARVHLSRVPGEIHALHVTMSGEHDGFAAVPDLRVEIVDHLSSTMALIDLGALQTESAAIALELYRRSGSWKVRAVAQGWDAGFGALVEHYGIAVEEPVQATPPVAPRATPPPPPAPSPPSGHPTPQSPPPPEPAPGLASARRGLFGPRRKDLERELQATRAQVASLGILDAIELSRLTEERRTELATVHREIATARAELDLLRSQVVETDDVYMLQAAGIYEFAHPLESSVAHKDRLKTLKERYKSLTRAQRAVSATTNWTINGSVQQGAKMVKDTSKLMLRAYNAEADNCVRVVRPHSLETNVQRLERARDAIAKLGAIMSIRITDEYHRLRVEEVRLTADYHAKVAEEREAQREAREREREDQRAQQEYERERERLHRERAQVERALDVALSGTADQAAVEQLRQRLAAVDDELEEAAVRAANSRLGFVYVISNIGAFGEKIVKIGMTRRREPMDRVRELGDASVPFLFDVHALIFSEDALGLEARLHAAFAHRRVNRVNLRREFFYVTPSEVRAELTKLKNEHLLDFTDTPLADEWRRSVAMAGGPGSQA
ncbi:DUF4041 domain-containing protein [Nocardioides acrostichi]|uniref:DUF4041 domain-containing protein n=1 Tax=Nocardioides acrostichi TaxID=2784339 RepID=A0A930V1M0_9ACTN|nr:DUF4041 domain-containing protein [Nocardioides acrostichi]MBF4162226.1 DUF4041 domain-containing protein [Nocardioides acrostichi]